MSSHPGKSYPTFQLKISEEAIYSNTSKERLFGYAIEAPKGPINEPTFVASNEEALRIFGLDFAPHFYQKGGGLILTRVGLPNAKSASITYCVETTTMQTQTESTTTTESTPIYSFTLYNDNQGSNTLGTGTMKPTGVTAEGYIQMEILTNSANEPSAEQQFYITDAATPDNTTLYLLYTDAGTTSAGKYVKLTQSEESNENETESTPTEIKTYAEAFTITAVDKGTSDIKVKVIESLGIAGGWTLIVDIPGVSSRTFNSLLTFKDIVKTINNKFATYLKAEQKADAVTHEPIEKLTSGQKLVVLNDPDVTVTASTSSEKFDELDTNDGVLKGGSFGQLFSKNTDMEAIELAKRPDGTYDESVLGDEASGYQLYSGNVEDVPESGIVSDFETITDSETGEESLAIRKDITLTAAVIYKKAFDLMKNIDLFGITTLSELDVVQAMLEEHIQECLDPETNILRFGITAFLDYNNPLIDSFTINDVMDGAILLNSEYFIYIGQGVKFKTNNGITYDLPPHKAIMLYTGIRSALKYETAIFGGEDKKILNGVVETLPIVPGETLYRTDREELNENGVTTFKQEYDRVTFLEGVTTTQESDVLSYENIMSIVIYITKRLVRVARAYQGKKMTEDLKESLKTALTSELRTIQQTDNCLIAIKDENYDIPPYDVTVESAALVKFNDNGELMRQSKVIAKVKIVPIGALRDIDLGVIVI